jgi:DNA-binding response OmpR family regulator
MKVLIVEDEKKVASFLKKGLEEEYYSVDIAFDGKEGSRMLSLNEYDLVILDIMLPFKDGVTLLKEIRSKGISTPALLLSAKNQVDDKVKGLDSGADDYLTKPFAFEELLARIRSLLRRKDIEKSILLKADNLTLDTQTHKITRGESEIILTPREYVILEYLLRNKNKVISRMKLTEHIYDYNFDPETNVIDVYINKLRNKIDKGFSKQLLNTVRGAGYSIRDN